MVLPFDFKALQLKTILLSQKYNCNLVDRKVQVRNTTNTSIFLMKIDN